MRTLNCGRHALIICAAAVLAGCGGSLPANGGIHANGYGATLQRSTPQTHFQHAAVPGTLLYVVTDSETWMLTYPGGKKFGKLSPSGNLGTVCPDPVNGNVFFNTHPGILEYAHGGTTKIGQLPDIGNDSSIGCAVDPTTGNLAVTYTTNQQNGFVAVYPGGSQYSKYSDPNMSQYFYCGYDNQGNLYVDGRGTNNQFLLTELPKGQMHFTDIALNLKLTDYGVVQWDGAYITVENPLTAIIYRIAISGSNGSVIGTTKLAEEHRVFPWIQGDTVIAGHWVAGQKKYKDFVVGLWHYPQGGQPYSVIGGLTRGERDTVTFVGVSVEPGR
jgi:hypothetical protein